MRLYLVHHGEAVGPDVDPSRPLSERGRTACERLAAEAATRGAKPVVVWHSGKLRARQTAEIFWRACNALAEFSATRDLQPDDSPAWMRDRLKHEPRDILIAGHYPYLPHLLAALLEESEGAGTTFPQHGVVTLNTDDGGQVWTEEWRLAPE